MIDKKTSVVVGPHRSFLSGNQRVKGSHAKIMGVCHWSPSVAKTDEDQRQPMFILSIISANVNGYLPGISEYRGIPEFGIWERIWYLGKGRYKLRPHWMGGRGVPQKQTKADEGGRGVRPIRTSIVLVSCLNEQLEAYWCLIYQYSAYRL